MGRKKWPKAPLELISLDFLVDLPRTAKGNVHLLVINDHFTKLIKLYAIKDRKASTVSACLHDYILTYGIPLKTLTDQDPSFESKLFKELCNSLGIKELRTSGYNPRRNGLTEQSNLTTKNYLTAFVTENKEWDCWLSELSFAYNSSIHTTTGFSPFELMFGRKAHIPLDILYNYHKESESIPVEQFKDNLNKMYAIAQEKMNARQDKYATYVDRKKLDDILYVDDKVYVYFPRMKRMKLVPNWYGPFRVIFADHPVYRIEIKTQNRTFTKVVTRDRIKRAKSDAIISNFNENVFMETESIKNNIEKVDCTEQDYSSESNDDNHNDNENADNMSITIWQDCGRD